MRSKMLLTKASPRVASVEHADGDYCEVGRPGGPGRMVSSSISARVVVHTVGHAVGRPMSRRPGGHPLMFAAEPTRACQ